MKFPGLLSILAVALLTSACPGLVPGSRAYRPLPQWESQFYVKAKRDIFPNDVREAPSKFAKTLVAWTGIITEINYRSEGSAKSVRLIAKHRYFDWIEDNGIQHEKFFLSPRGEGLFAVGWRIDSNEDQEFINQFEVGDMFVAYGYPSMIKGEVVGMFPTENIRSIKPEWYRTDVLDYGRPGSKVTLLKTPL